jgi:hypothetical protein
MGRRQWPASKRPSRPNAARANAALNLTRLSDLAAAIPADGLAFKRLKGTAECKRLCETFNP